MMWMDVDTALSEVPVNYVALIDDTDFKTREETVTYDQSGMDLVWNFTTTAGATTQTAVTPTTGGDYDWTNQGNGMYTIEIPASGGASINNDTEGFGWFTGFATGILPWTGPMIGFRAAALNNALIDGGDNLDTNPVQLGGDTQSLTDLKDFADAGYDPATNKVQGVVLTDTLTTYTGNTPQTADHTAAIADIPTNAEFNARTLPSADYVVTTDTIAAVTDVVNPVTTDAASRTASQADVSDIPTVAEFEARTLPAADYVVVTDTLARVTLVDTTTTNTDMRGTDGANTDKTGYALSAAGIDAILDETIGDGTLTMRETLRVCIAILAGETSGGGTTTLTFRNNADTQNVLVETVDANGNRTATTLTP
jgi:hypothetical protein